MTTQKSRQQLQEEAYQLSHSLIEKVFSIPQELLKISRSFPNRQSEVSLKMAAGLPADCGSDYQFLTLSELPEEVVIMGSNYSSEGTKRGIVPKRKYKALWKTLETNYVWQLEDNEYLRQCAMDLDTHLVSVSRGERKNSFHFYGFAGEPLSAGCFVFNEIDRTKAKSLKPYEEIITRIRKLSKYARHRIHLDIFDEMARLGKKKQEIEQELKQHPTSIANENRGKHRLEYAIEFYQKAIEQIPNDYDAQYWLILLYAQKGEIDKALEQWQKFSQVANGVKEQKVWLSIAKDEIERFRKRI